MYLNRKHIYRFIKEKFGLRQKDIAPKVFTNETEVVSGRPYPELLYEAIFKVEKDQEPGILSELKDFIIKLKVEDNFDAIWDAEYEEFIKSILLRSDIAPERKPQRKSRKKLPNSSQISTRAYKPLVSPEIIEFLKTHKLL